MKKYVFGFAALLSITAMSAAPAQAQIVTTGTYTIDIVCKLYDELGLAKTKSDDQTMTITQNMTDLNVVLAGAVSNGRLMVDADKPETAAAASVVSCTVNNDLDFTGMNYNILSQINFSVSGTAIKVKGSYHSGAALGDTFIQYCKFKGTRTAEADPAVAACAP